MPVHQEANLGWYWKLSQLPGVRKVIDLGGEPIIPTLLNQHNP